MPVQILPTSPRRLGILGEEEIDALYGLPHFTDEERREYLSLAPPEKAALEQFHSLKSRISFLLQLGYFKSHHLFFVFTLADVTEDVRYIQEQYFPHISLTNLDIAKMTRQKQQEVILDLFRYRSCDATHRRALTAKARQAATISAKPIYVFRELLHYLKEHHLVAPGYSVMQDLVGQALTYEQDRLATIVSEALTQQERALLDNLLEDTPGLSEITQLRREPRDFSAKQIKRERQRGEQLRPLYQLAQRVLPRLAISNESIKYYASLVGYYSVYKLKRFPVATTYIYLLCFVSHRYQRLHDNLISCLLYHVRRYTESAKEAAKDRVYTYRMESNENLDKAGRVLKLFTDDGIAPNALFRDVQAKAFTILDRQQLAFIATHITKHARFDETAFQWEHLEELAQQFKLQLRPLLLAVDWTAVSGYAPLLEAVGFLQAAFRKGRPLSQYASATFPQRFIPDSATRYVCAPDKSPLPDRYEFLAYRLLRNGLEAGDIFCRDSVRFRSFEDDLLDDQQWQAKDQLIEDTGLAILKQPIREHLADLEKRLEARLVEVNQRIASGANEHFETTRRGTQARWTLRYPRSSEPANHPFFDDLDQVDISSVLSFVNQHCPFMPAFEHVLGRYTKQTVDEDVITACLLAWGTNMGLGRMAAISDIGYQALSTASDNFIRLETLREANDRVSNAIAALPIFRHYDLGDTLHSSSDGQKFETRIHTINARHSPKYFGLKKGVVSYTLVTNHVPVHADIIGAHDHESHYVFDILFNNTTDIQPTVHSTDTHGTNEVNFAILSLFGYQFAPRYRDIYGKVQKALYGFQHPSQYPSEMVLRPIRKLSPELIVEEWENIQRIMVSLALKTTTQSIIVRKLSAFARTNKTRRALWEYDNIIRSLYLLDYIDSPPLRRNVQRALNRGENYHQLRRAVSYANFGKLRFKTEHEQQIWGECARLLTNCIIYYNARLLSQVRDSKEAAGDVQGAALLTQVSPVAWQHLNFYGRYEFRKGPQAINMEEIVQALAHAPVRQILEG
jgi:TnpA family transposase